MTGGGDLGAAGWQRTAGRGYSAFIDSDRYSRQVTTPAATASGVITASFPPVAAGRLWLVERFVVVCTSSTATVATFYADAVSILTIVEGTASGNFDIADENSPLVVDPLSTLIVQWQGAALGAVGTCRAQIRELIRVGGTPP
jgi:hypothetical protein